MRVHEKIREMIEAQKLHTGKDPTHLILDSFTHEELRIEFVKMAGFDNKEIKALGSVFGIRVLLLRDCLVI